MLQQCLMMGLDRIQMQAQYYFWHSQINGTNFTSPYAHFQQIMYLNPCLKQNLLKVQNLIQKLKT